MRAVVLMALFSGLLIAVPYRYLPYLLRPLYQGMINVCLELGRRIGRLSEALGRHVIDQGSQCSHGRVISQPVERCGEIISSLPDDPKPTISRLDVIFRITNLLSFNEAENIHAVNMR